MRHQNALATTEESDPLLLLPAAKVVTYKQRKTIYNADLPPNGLYLVVEGLVQVLRPLNRSGGEMIVDIHGSEEFFGDRVLLGEPLAGERAIALTDSRVMCWTAIEARSAISHRPELGWEFLKVLARRNVDLIGRLESFCSDSISRRLMWAMRRFALKFGRAEGGELVLPPMSHEQISQYIGTSREIVTHYMCKLRRDGIIDYDRKAIHWRPAAADAWIRQEAN